MIGCAGVASGPSQPVSQRTLQRTVEVALVDSFSGSGAAVGRRAENSLRVQVDALNARGGLLGRRVEVISADDESNPDKARELVRELLNDSRVQLLVGPGSSATFDAVKPAVRRAQVPNCVSTVADAAMADSPFTFRTAPADRDRLSSLLAYLRRDHPEVTSVGLIDGGGQPAQLGDDLVGEQASGRGLSYIGRASAGFSDADAVSAVQQLAGQGAQAALVSGRPELVARVAAGIVAAGLQGKLPLLGLDGVGDYSFPSLTGDAAGGSAFAGSIQSYLTPQPEAAWPAGYRDFVHRVSQAYGYGTDGVEITGAPAVADCVRQWSSAVRRAGTFAGPEVTRAWEQLDVPATQTALGVREKASPANHTTVAADSVFVYSWVRRGSAYRLRQLAGPVTG
ncbi:MAG: ABC transporter substrate-binding protein [Candidatus Dormibacteraeota bacterium]|nr:ABC transporter substrate-binding protein [Candidatus Dormibacteraeota bacterium]